MHTTNLSARESKAEKRRTPEGGWRSRRRPRMPPAAGAPLKAYGPLGAAARGDALSPPAAAGIGRSCRWQRPALLDREDRDDLFPQASAWGAGATPMVPFAPRSLSLEPENRLSVADIAQKPLPARLMQGAPLLSR